jgi:putative FmdB family regulatory protein
MPIYEYSCQACAHELEALQKLSDAALQNCPQCGKPELKKKISAAGFRLKGGGWYETDFKKSGKKNLADSGGSGGDSGAAAKGDGSAAKSDSSSASTAPATATS